MARGLFPGDARELSLALLEEGPMRELNAGYRGVDAATDVLAFSQVEGEEAGAGRGRAPELLGDVVICVPVARRQAAERGETLMEELELLAAHGMLHLAGYDDDTPEAAGRMRAAEKAMLGRSIIG